MYKNLFDKEKKLYCKDICYTFYKDRDIYINCICSVSWHIWICNSVLI